VPEQLRLQKRLGERRAGQLHERAAAASAQAMNRLRQQPLAGAALAGQEDGGPAGSNLLRPVEDGPHRRVIAHHAQRGRCPGTARALGAGLFPEEGPLHRAVQGAPKRLAVERLLEEVVGASLHGVDGDVHRPEARHDDDSRPRRGGPHALQERQSVEARHSQVGEDDLRPELVEQLETPEGVARRGDLVAPLAQQPLQRGAGPRLIVHDEDPPGSRPRIRLFRRRLGTRASRTRAECADQLLGHRRFPPHFFIAAGNRTVTAKSSSNYYSARAGQSVTSKSWRVPAGGCRIWSARLSPEPHRRWRTRLATL
jgi:hypothetical protein